MKDCTTCKWWTPTWGCYNSDWTIGKVTDPKEPLCGGLGWRKIPIKSEM